MIDTKPEIQKRFVAMMRQKSGIERLKMGFSMFDMAKELVIVSLLAAGKGDKIRKELFLRFYHTDFKPEMAAKILRLL